MTVSGRSRSRWLRSPATWTAALVGCVSWCLHRGVNKSSPCLACKCASAPVMYVHKQMPPDPRRRWGWCRCWRGGGWGGWSWSLTCRAGERLKSICCALYAEHFNSRFPASVPGGCVKPFCPRARCPNCVIFFPSFLSSTSNIRFHWGDGEDRGDVALWMVNITMVLFICSQV